MTTSTDSGVVPSLEELRQAGFFEPLDVHLACSLAAISGESEPEVLLAAALASRGPQNGQVCVPLRSPPSLEVAAADFAPEGEEPPLWRWPEPEAWADALRSSPLVGDGSARVPLVLDGDLRLYLYRYFHYQQQLGESLMRRARPGPGDVDTEILRRGLVRLFGPPSTDGRTDWQRVGAVMAVLQRLSVISGGPGTGKTSTVLKILALLQEQARATGAFPLRMTLLAPTGKAAARLAESIKLGKSREDAFQLDVDQEILASIPDEAKTIHRCLGYQPARPTHFYHDAETPLPTDVVVVDESSMVDLALMTKLFDAVPSRARVMLLGDRDQLASVEAGAILGDICNVGGDETSWSSDLRTRAAAATGEEAPNFGVPRSDEPGISDCLIHLRKSYRFGAKSGIGALSRAINAGDAPRVLEYLEGGRSGEVKDLEWISVDETTEPAESVGNLLVEGFRSCLEQHDPASALEELGKFRILCAHRRGAFGVEAINDLVRDLLALRGDVPARGLWYHGRPVMITRNDEQTGLFNGDVGLALGDGDRPDSIRVHFPTQTTRFHPARLPAHETAFALTVHKSQGSEFNEVVLLLPRRVSPILSRELLYTGVTRAKKKVTVVSRPEVIAEAVARRVQRASGLRSMLWARDAM